MVCKISLNPGIDSCNVSQSILTIAFPNRIVSREGYSSNLYNIHDIHIEKDTNNLAVTSAY